MDSKTYIINECSITSKEAIEIGRRAYEKELFDFIKQNSVSCKISGKKALYIDSEKLLNKIINK